jgi:hypothetical protein
MIFKDLFRSTDEFTPQAEVPVIDEHHLYEIKLLAPSENKIGMSLNNTRVEVPAGDEETCGGEAQDDEETGVAADGRKQLFGFLVSKVGDDSEAMRLGIRKGDYLLGISGHPELTNIEAILFHLESRPAWLQLTRPFLNSPEAQEPYRYPTAQLTQLAYYQKGVGGDGAQHSVEELQRWSPNANYLKVLAKRGSIEEVTPVDRALFSAFLSSDTIGAAEGSRGGLQEKLDTHKGSRMFRAIEPNTPVSLNGTAFGFIVGFIGGGLEARKKHTTAAAAYVAKSYHPWLAKAATDRSKAFQFIIRHWEPIEAHVRSLVEQSAGDNGEGHGDGSAAEAGVLKSIAVQALKEREEVRGQFIALHQHPDPASTHKQHLLLRRMHKLGRDAKRAQEAAAEVEAKAASRGVRGGCGGEAPAAAEEMTEAAPATTVTPAPAASPAAATGAAPAAAPDGPGAMEDGE